MRASARTAPLGAACVALALLLGGCASPPIETDVAPDARRPQDVAAAPDTASGSVLWGGVVLDTRNNDANTRLEVLGYPLDRAQRPITDGSPQGRFLILVDGYVETVDYAPGRLVTVLGTLDGVREGQVDEARLVYPAVRSETLHLWRPETSNENPRFSFGLGIGLGN